MIMFYVFIVDCEMVKWFIKHIIDAEGMDDSDY